MQESKCLMHQNQIENTSKGCLIKEEEVEHLLAYLDIREEHLQHIRTRVAGVEKHKLGLLQMIGGETFLDLDIAAIKDINNCLDGNNLVDQATDIITNTICRC